MSAIKLAAAMIGMAFSNAMDAAKAANRIVVFDQAGVGEPTLRKASDTARRMFHVAGIETVWTVCRASADSEEHCVLPPAGEYLQVFVRRNGKGLERTHEGMGLALITHEERKVVCYAFVEPAAVLAELAHGSLDVVLGSVLAHEVGHLMGLQHSASGVMKANFEAYDIIEAGSGRLLFDPSGSKVLRAAH